MDATSPRISVLVPSFDDGATLDEALASIAGQSLGDLEVVVSDDGSSDASPGIAAAWVARDARFRALRNERNLGMTENWNRALDAARGDYVAKLDADDLWRPRALEELHAAFDRSAGLLASFCRVDVREHGTGVAEAWPGDAALRAAGYPPEEAHVARGRALWLASHGDAQLWHSNAFLAPREEIARLGGFDERWSCASDTALILRLLAEDRPVAHSPYAGVVYRRRAGSVSASFERRGWKELEGQLVRLDAIARDGRRLGPLPRHVRQSWWQAWVDARRLAAVAPLWSSMPERLRRKLRAAFDTAPSPPLLVRVEGWLRLRGWRLRSRLRGGEDQVAAA